MCGFIVSKNINTNLVDLAHRGPDDRGSIRVGDMSFRHWRLSVQGVSDDALLLRQPYFLNENSKPKTILCYNGEIYNQDHLRKTYLKNIELKTTGDTELVYRLIDTCGVGILSELDGIFSIVFWKNNVIHMARDPFGVKPLFFWKSGKKFLCSSEIGPILTLVRPELTHELLPEFIKYKYVGNSKSIYSGVTKVSPGTIVSLDQNLEESRQEFFSLEGSLTCEGTRNCESLESDLRLAVESQRVGDVELGIQLSGGV
jgi:asparagine synthase (glutamine-hydrolysing)